MYQLSKVTSPQLQLALPNLWEGAERSALNMETQLSVVSKNSLKMQS